jgi:hypothetical protein
LSDLKVVTIFETKGEYMIKEYSHERELMDENKQAMTTKEINKRFSELAGICWHEIVQRDEYSCTCSCGAVYAYGSSYLCHNPNYCADPRLVLEVIPEKDTEEFINYILDQETYRRPPTPMDFCLVLVGLFKNTTGLLALEGIEFMEGRK